MGVRVEIGDGERIGQALRRLKRLLVREGIFYRLWKRQQGYVKPGQVRRLKEGNAKIAACQAAYRRRRELGIE